MCIIFGPFFDAISPRPTITVSFVFLNTRFVFTLNTPRDDKGGDLNEPFNTLYIFVLPSKNAADNDQLLFDDPLEQRQ